MKLSSKPTLREKKRYIYFKVRSRNTVRFVDVKNAGWDSILDIMGELGAAKANPHFIRNLWDNSKQEGVIRCSHLFTDQIKLALSLIHHIGDEQVIFQSLKVSGTIKGTGQI